LISRALPLPSDARRPCFNYRSRHLLARDAFEHAAIAAIAALRGAEGSPRDSRVSQAADTPEMPGLLS